MILYVMWERNITKGVYSRKFSITRIEEGRERERGRQSDIILLREKSE